VHIYSGAPAPAPTQNQPQPGPGYYTLKLQNPQPRAGSTINYASPYIAANFSHPVEPGSVVISVDGRSVTSQAFIGPNSFSVTPPFELRSGTRGVSVTGTSATGRRFEQSWSFNVVPRVSTRNFVQIRSPGQGATVTLSSFQVAGRTLPLSVVTVRASSAASYPSYPGLIGPGPGFTQQVRADPLGNFSTNASMPNVGGYVRVFVQSVAPDGSSAEASITVPSQ
jgi:hypothetical protein